MNKSLQRLVPVLGGIGLILFHSLTVRGAVLGEEVAIPRHLQDGEEFRVPLPDLIAYGEKLLAANWTDQEGRGRPLTKGTGARLADPSEPLVFPRSFNRVSAPDANSCAGCHNAPFGAGGGGDIVANVFVLGQRFDFATFDPGSSIPTKNSVDEAGMLNTLQTIANSRATLGMFGSGYIELLAREMTADLQSIRDSIHAGEAKPLTTKGVEFGVLARGEDGSWDVSGVTGLFPPSLKSTGGSNPPSLIVRPFHQVGAVISLREFSNNAFNHHHGLFTTLRQSIQAHGGEARETRAAFRDLGDHDQACVIEFLKTLQVLPPGTQHLVVDEHGRKKAWHGQANRSQTASVRGHRAK